jgi:hypothetical protein
MTIEVSLTLPEIGYRAVNDYRIAASPKLRGLLDERKTVVIAPVESAGSAGYRTTGADSITASPKLRQQLNDRAPQQIEIAPLR